MKNKIIFFIIIITMSVSFTACDKSGTSSETTTEENTTELTTEKITTEENTTEEDTTEETTTEESATVSSSNSSSSKTTSTTKNTTSDEADVSQANEEQVISSDVQETVSNIVSSYTNSSMSAFEKVKAIHDYLVDTVDYTVTSDNSCHTAEGALINQEAVCDGYAYAFELLMEELGYDCDVVYGYADNGSSSENHAWNVVKINGKWYQMDVTWDDPLVNGSVVTDGSNISYDYFLLDDSTMYEDHTIVSKWNTSGVPTCSSTAGIEWIEDLLSDEFWSGFDGPYYVASSLSDGVSKALSYSSQEYDTIYILFDSSDFTDMESTFNSFYNKYNNKINSGDYGIKSVDLTGETSNGYIVITLEQTYY